ncbi:MAG: Stp1/IreP family PP2C-type Ser/Thr phosphatase [Erysipelotrichales bacterium]|nr:Stp1/IreP family PP2C-type Ser/Thr phosphatase [Erysipelotrichales bacterium]
MRTRIGTFTYVTDIGKVRTTNEDVSIAIKNKSNDVLMVVCDGMGGYTKGDVAASIALNTLKDEFEKIDHFFSALEVRKFLSRNIKKANQKIYKIAHENGLSSKMGTTITAVIIRKNTIFVVSIGDTRAYIVEDEILRITDDDSYVNYLYRLNRISFEDMETHPKRHILMNALGLTPNVSFEVSFYRHDNSRILLCSDGLYTMVSEEKMHKILTSKKSIDEKCQMLINEANKNGGKDNIGIALWEVSSNECK